MISVYLLLDYTLFPTYPNSSVKQLPFPTVDCTVIFPPCRFITCLHKLSPMPEPEGLVVKNGTKILSCTSGRMPSPLSLTVIRHCHERAGSIFTSIRGCSFLLHASLAFLIRLISTCSICVRSIWSMRSVSGSSIRIYSSENSFCKSCNSSRTATGRRTGAGSLVSFR